MMYATWSWELGRWWWHATQAVGYGSLVTLLVWFDGPAAAGQQAPGEPLTSPQVVAQKVDELLSGELASHQYRPAPAAGDAVFLRRVFLDLIGEPPTPDDVLAFLSDRSPNKKTRVVEKLLADRQFGVNWASYWRDVILYRRTEERARITAQPLLEYLSDAFNENRPWSQIATELITARGDVRQNGATALIMAQAGKPEEIVSEVSRIFMGIQIQCAQCHDHPTERWKREQFHQLAAFFPRVAVRPDRSGERRTFLVTVNDSPLGRMRRPGAARFVGTAEHYMPDLSDPEAQGTLMRPVFFVTGQSLPIGVSDAERRGALAGWLTSPENPWFAKAFVNRLWAELCGEGFYEPVDELGPDHTPVAPKTLDYLAGEFARSGYDVKWLFRVITFTNLYQREGRVRRDASQPPMQANVVQPLRADVLLNCVVAALAVGELPLQRPGAVNPGPVARGPREQFHVTFGYDPSVPRDEVVTTVPQALAMMNAPNLVLAMSARGPALRSLLTNYPDDSDAISYLYLQTLSRLPSEKELRWAERQIKNAGSRETGYEDLLWALVNSTEFAYRP